MMIMIHNSSEFTPKADGRPPALGPPSLGARRALWSPRVAPAGLRSLGRRRFVRYCFYDIYGHYRHIAKLLLVIGSCYTVIDLGFCRIRATGAVAISSIDLKRAANERVWRPRLSHFGL